MPFQPICYYSDNLSVFRRLKKNSEGHGVRSNSPTKDLSPKNTRQRSKSPTKNSPTKTRSPMPQVLTKIQVPDIINDCFSE